MHYALLHAKGKVGLLVYFNKPKKMEVNAMTLEIQKVLYATDLSDNSAYAFRHAIDFAQKHDAKIIIVHVLEVLPSYVQGMTESYFSEKQQKRISDEAITHVLDRIKKRLKEFCNKELENDPESLKRVESIGVFRGCPADEILKKVDELGCDAIVMGTHGKGIIGNTFLGSVTKKVLRRVRKPVFIIPLPKGETDSTFNDL